MGRISESFTSSTRYFRVGSWPYIETKGSWSIFSTRALWTCEMTVVKRKWLWRTSRAVERFVAQKEDLADAVQRYPRRHLISGIRWITRYSCSRQLTTYEDRQSVANRALLRLPRNFLVAKKCGVVVLTTFAMFKILDWILDRALPDE